MSETTFKTPEIARLGFETDLGAGARARIGLLVLESDQTMEWEMRQMADLSGVALYHARLANQVEVTPETLVQMELEIPKAAALLPGYLGLKAIGYGCTSGSTMIGALRPLEVLTPFAPACLASPPRHWRGVRDRVQPLEDRPCAASPIPWFDQIQVPTIQSAPARPRQDLS